MEVVFVMHFSKRMRSLARPVCGVALIMAAAVGVGGAVTSATKAGDLGVSVEPVPLGDGLTGIPMEQAAAIPQPTEAETARASAAVVDTLQSASGAMNAVVASTAPWSDGAGNPLGIAVEVHFGRDVTFPKGLPQPASGPGEDGGGFQPTAEKPYEVLEPTGPLTTDRVTAFFDLRTNEIAFVRVIKFPTLDQEGQP